MTTPWLDPLLRRLRRPPEPAPAHWQHIADRHDQPYWLVDDSDESGAHVEILIDVPRYVWQRPQRRRAGYMYLTWPEPDIMCLADIRVEPPYRACGLGTLLITMAKRYARDFEARRIVGWVPHPDLAETPHLLEWYKRQGFTVKRPSESGAAADLDLVLTNDSHL